jgi:plastocyanin
VRRGVKALAAVGSLALALAGASGALAGGKPKTIKVGDDYYAPAKVTVKAGTTVKWNWLAGNTNTHDVRLKSGPRGVKHFKSEIAASDYSFKRTLKVPGKYRIYCSLHEAMVETITVKK